MDFLFLSAEYCIAYILAIATLQSPLSCYSLALPVLIPACVSLINPFPCRSDSVCTSFGLLLVYLDYLSALPCWIFFADRRPMLAVGLLFVCPYIYIYIYIYLFDPCLFPITPSNKALQMDPHASHLVTLSITQGIFPSAWKFGVITPVHKSGS